MVLHDGEPTVVGLVFQRSALIGDVFERNLLELVLVRVEGHAGVGRVHGAFTVGLARVTRELVVNRGLDRGGRRVFHVGADLHRVFTAGERVGARQDDTVLFGAEDHLKVVVRTHVKLLADEFKTVLVVGEVATGQARLRGVGAAAVGLQQHHVAQLFL